MAKLDTSTVKKSKAKKRKNPNPEHEDEVANKSVILEDTTPQHEDIEEATEETNTTENNNEQATTKKSKKRKNKEKSNIKEKRSKSGGGEADDGAASDHEVGDGETDGIQEPTLEQLKESEKPENNLAIVTGRQKKKQKHQKLVEVQKGQSLEKEKQRNEEYLKKWKNSREEWKFEKLRQISIQQTMFDEHVLTDELWAIALEYLAGSKGAAKEKVTKLANDVIDEIDKLCEENEAEEEKQELVNSTKYQRARDLLQIFT